jgi:AcrR family transcriptional regulator
MSYNGESRKQKAAAMKQKIYDSAEQLLASKDFREISVDSIVKTAGVSKGSFYVHFTSKDALMAALVSDHVIKVDSDYKGFLDSFPDDVLAETALLSLISKITGLIIEEIGIDNMKAVYKAQISKDFDTGSITNYNREIYKIFSDVLERGIKRGELKTDMPLDMLTRHFMMAIRGITYEWCIRYPEFDYQTEALSHFKIMLAGLRKPAV